MKSLKGQVLLSTAPTTPWPRGGWLQSGRVQDGGFEDTPPLCVQQSQPHTADSIEHSADLVEPVFQVLVMASPQSADGDLVLP